MPIDIQVNQLYLTILTNIISNFYSIEDWVHSEETVKVCENDLFFNNIPYLIIDNLTITQFKIYLTYSMKINLDTYQL